MKSAITISLLAILAGCAQPHYRSHDCDSLFYGQYQAMAEPKAMAFAIPVPDPQIPTQYDTRCWARAAAAGVPRDMSAEEAMNAVVSGVLRDCKEYKNKNNPVQRARELECRIAAKNMVWEPWMQELRAAEAGARGECTAPAGSDSLPAAPTAAAVASVRPPPESNGSGDAALRVHDEFDWCSAPGNSCTTDRVIEIHDPGTGQLLGRLAIAIHPEKVQGDSLEYTVQFKNESRCKIAMEGSSIMQDGKVLGGWLLQNNYLEPSEIQSSAETFSFRPGALSRAAISISVRIEECPS